MYNGGQFSKIGSMYKLEGEIKKKERIYYEAWFS
jgi:hypothetical protein